MAITDTAAGEPRSCTVTSGRSTLIGRSLVAALIQSNLWTVRIADPSPPPPDPAADPFLSAAIRSGRASYRHVDLRDPSQARSAVDGSSAVFHVDPTTTTTTSSPSASDLYLISIQGTKNLIAACQACGVERMVYTGSADVVFDGVRGICGGDESIPYPDKFADWVSELRMQVEAMVLSANSGGMSTCALRACNVFGPGDADLVPFIVGGAKSGWLKFIIGNGKNICDFTYVENVAHANICAEQALSSEIASVAGEPFFITNKESLRLWEFISNILEGLGYQRPWIHLPFKFVLYTVMLVEKAHKKLGFPDASNSHLTPAIVRTLSCTRTFDCSKAQKHIGYLPIVSLQDGVTLTVESFSHLAKDSAYSRQRDLSEPSKADKLLGSGKVADILLWRDDKKTFICVLSLFLLLYWFLLSGRTFVSSAAKLLLVVSVILFVQGVLPSSVFGFTIEKLPSSSFEISELDVQHSFIALGSLWNSGIRTLRSLAEGDDWNAFFKAAGFLYLVKLFLPVPLSILIGVGLICLFTLFILYEQYEEEIEKLMTITSVGVNKSKEKLIANLPGFMVTYIQTS